MNLPLPITGNIFRSMDSLVLLHLIICTENNVRSCNSEYLKYFSYQGRVWSLLCTFCSAGNHASISLWCMASVQTVIAVKKEKKSSRNWKIVKGSRFHAVPRKMSPMWADDYLSNHQLFHKLFHFFSHSYSYVVIVNIKTADARVKKK